MIMPKNLCCLMKSHSAGGRSAWTWVISQSLICLHRSSTGPSRKACSSSVSFGAGCDSSWSQSGSPENSSPSKPTEPDSSAMRSVCDSGGRILVELQQRRGDQRLADGGDQQRQGDQRRQRAGNHGGDRVGPQQPAADRSEEHTSELQSLK